MAASTRLARALHAQPGDEPTEDLISWMAQMEDDNRNLRELLEEFADRMASQFRENAVTLGACFTEVDARFERLEFRLERVDARLASDLEVVGALACVSEVVGSLAGQGRSARE